MQYLPDHDPVVARTIKQEESRIENTLDLIAAENHAPRSIFKAQGSIFSTKAAEGYPGSRFHPGGFPETGHHQRYQNRQSGRYNPGNGLGRN